MMQKWKYEVVDFQDRYGKCDDKGLTRRLSVHFGEQGWELVSVDNDLAFFKRPIDEPVTIKGSPYPAGTYFDKNGNIALVIDESA